ncbi:MAG: T9SS type A sorting domain-containing protein [Ignavibacteriaceae bacterium]|nr:T9SS type A sorting domain-containing protein [Ignavibacteriaceae bacterium]
MKNILGLAYIETIPTNVEYENGEDIPTDYALFQNYPNPFNPKTNIQYAISSRQFVSLKVYDVLGNEIETLVNEEKPAGKYEITFDASKLTSGIYFYQLKSKSFIETKKMILLK